MRFCLGTVQFGMEYGISNKLGQSSIDEVKRILLTAKEKGITHIDTASLYGNSEEILGKTLMTGHSFKIITKTPKFTNNTIFKNRLLRETFYESLKKINQTFLYGLLLHDSDELFFDNAELVINEMISLKKRGLVEKIGVSVYNSAQIDKALEYPIDLIQLPLNVLDQRLLTKGYLKILKERHIEVYARSIFLQGLLLMEPTDLPKHFLPVINKLVLFRSDMMARGFSSLQGALGFINSIEEVDFAVVGVNNASQLEEIVLQSKMSLPIIDYSKYAYDEEIILNPSRWEL